MEDVFCSQPECSEMSVLILPHILLADYCQTLPEVDEAAGNTFLRDHQLMNQFWQLCRRLAHVVRRGCEGLRGNSRRRENEPKIYTIGIQDLHPIAHSQII